MKNKRPLAPGFLNKLDRYLLLNKPSVWSSRTHLVLYYGFLSLVVLTLLAFLAPDDPRQDSQAAIWVGFVSVVSFIGLIIYVIYLLRFNVFKRFGIDGPSHRLIGFILTYIAIGTFVLFPYVQPYVETVRASNQYTDQEIIRDLNDINISIAKLEYDSVYHGWRKDPVKIVNTIGVNDQEYNSNNYSTPAVIPESDSFSIIRVSPVINRVILQKNLVAELNQADSAVKINDSVYLFLHCPNYTPLSPYFGSSFPTEGRHSSLDIYKQVIKDYRKPDRNAEWKKLTALIAKYKVKESFVYYYDPVNYINRLTERYSINEVENSMQNIAGRIHRFDADNLVIFFRIHFYVTLCLTLLLFSFRHSTVKSFFFGLLTGFVLTIITSLILAFSLGENQYWTWWILFYFFLFFVVSLYSFQSKSRSLITGIAINLFFWLLPFIPMVCVGAYYESSDRHYIDYDLRQEQMQRNFATAEWIGVVLLLIFLVTYIHKVYRKWYASPEE